MKKILKKILEKLGKYLYYKYGDIDVAEMTRLQLIGHVERVSFQRMSEGRKIEMKDACIDLLENDALKYIADEYIDDIKDHILYKANTEQEMLLGRFSLNGAAAIFERVEEYAKWNPPKKEEFNKFDTI